MMTTRKRGFTLVEVLVVVAIIAIIAGIVMPRLSGQSQRAALAAADDAADLLTLFAHRDSLGDANIAVAFDSASNTLMMVQLLGDPSFQDDPLRWEIDRYASPVRLPDDLQIVSVLEDGIRIDARDWMIPLVPGQGRASIELTLASTDVQVTLVLPSYAFAASVLRSGDRLSETRRIIDLDRAGRDREIW